jgi:hypothetical protein
MFLADSPPRLTRSRIEDGMTGALNDYDSYLQYLAEGKLDGFMDSLKPEDNNLPKDLINIQNKRGPFLLLNGLGRSFDQKRIKDLFSEKTVFVAVGFAHV